MTAGRRITTRHAPFPPDTLLANYMIGILATDPRVPSQTAEDLKLPLPARTLRETTGSDSLLSRLTGLDNEFQRKKDNAKKNKAEYLTRTAITGAFNASRVVARA